jgi:hypothetical protein
MRGQTFVAVYRSRRDAEEARDQLRGLGVSERDIELGDDDGRLFDEDALPDERIRYRAYLREGRTAVCVRLRPDYDADRLIDMMEETDPLDLDEEPPDEVERRHRVRSYVAEPPIGHEAAPAPPRPRRGRR